jgi:hypothetical protein
LTPGFISSALAMFEKKVSTILRRLPANDKREKYHFIGIIQANENREISQLTAAGSLLDNQPRIS